MDITNNAHIISLEIQFGNVVLNDNFDDGGKEGVLSIKAKFLGYPTMEIYENEMCDDCGSGEAIFQKGKHLLMALQEEALRNLKRKAIVDIKVMKTSLSPDKVPVMVQIGYTNVNIARTFSTLYSKVYSTVLQNCPLVKILSDQLEIIQPKTGTIIGTMNVHIRLKTFGNCIVTAMQEFLENKVEMFDKCFSNGEIKFDENITESEYDESDDESDSSESLGDAAFDKKTKDEKKSLAAALDKKTKDGKKSSADATLDKKTNDGKKSSASALGKKSKDRQNSKSKSKTKSGSKTKGISFSDTNQILGSICDIREEQDRKDQEKQSHGKDDPNSKDKHSQSGTKTRSHSKGKRGLLGHIESPDDRVIQMIPIVARKIEDHEGPLSGLLVDETATVFCLSVAKRNEARGVFATVEFEARIPNPIVSPKERFDRDAQYAVTDIKPGKGGKGKSKKKKKKKK